MYCCTKCGKWTEELPTAYQVHGVSSLGDEYREKFVANCSCGGDFAEAFRCEVCGDWFATEDGCKPIFKICDKCLEEEQTVDNAIEIGEGDPKSIKLNGFFSSVLGEDKVNEILSAWVKENIKDTDVRVFGYCCEDMSFFREFVACKKGL